MLIIALRPFSPDSKVVGVIYLVDLHSHWLTSRERASSILESPHLTCKKMLAVTHSQPTRIDAESKKAAFEADSTIKAIKGVGTQVRYFDYDRDSDAPSYAWPLVHSLLMGSKPISLQSFCNVIPRS